MLRIERVQPVSVGLQRHMDAYGHAIAAQAACEQLGRALPDVVAVMVGEDVQCLDPGRRLECLDAVRRQRSPYRDVV